RYGTMSFGQVAEAAIRLARDGFPADPRFCDTIVANEAKYRRFPGNTAVFLPGGKPPTPGQIFRQTDLANSIQYMVDAEKAAAGGGRAAGLAAAHRAFYEGDIAATICRYHAENGGWLTREDMAAFRARLEPPVCVRQGQLAVYTCGPWSQGPLLGMILRMLANDNLTALGHNSAAYVHLLTEAVKLACADREAYFGDPRFVDVPLEALLSPELQARRRALIDPRRAYPDLREPVAIGGARPGRAVAPHERTPALSPDTTYGCVIDSQGNVFSATPSDASYDAELIPGTGLVASGRGSQSWAAAGHPSEVMPGKRPRLTPNPAIAVLEDGRALMPFGTPGGDVQTQAMLQVLLNISAFGMDLRTAVEAPRFASYAFPSSFEPHEAYPNRLAVEGRMDEATFEGLEALGHDVLEWPDWTRLAGTVNAIVKDQKAGVLTAASDPRRATWAVGW
ncbi:MAG: gamma-glutamyltransferase family protein, partial [Hyphomicrobiaceae bacterium]